MTHEDKLIKKAEQGDYNAFNELIQMYYPEILRYCMWHTPTKEFAEDATQETFLKTIHYFDRYIHKGNFKSFLYKVAVNTCIDIKRKKWLSDISIESISEHEETNEQLSYIEMGFEEIQGNLMFKQLIDKLPDDTKELLILRYSQELSIREIAQTLDLPLRTVQSRLRAALKKLRK